MRARSVLFTLFGDVVRPAGGEAWLATITAAMQLLGIQPPAVRTALHRMAGEGWVQPRRQGRYAAYGLTERGVARLEEAAQRIYRLRSREWDGRWHLLIADQPDRVADAVAELEWIGFGRIGSTVWISPHAHDEAVSRLGLDGLVTTFAGAATEDDVATAARAWDLAGLRTRHEAFLAGWQDLDVPADPAEAFAVRLRLVHEWRKFLFLDPGLPVEVLPEDWPGQVAAEVFRAAYERLLEPSWTWYAQTQARVDGTTRTTGMTGANPFAPGLAALGGQPTR